MDKVSDAFVSTVNEWLISCGGDKTKLRLKKVGEGTLSNLVTEILNNAERHSSVTVGIEGGWYMAGFMRHDETSQDDSKYVCHIGIMSLGQSIGESLCECQDPKSSDLIAKYIQRHAHVRAGDADWTELLRTICALQDGVTRLPQDEARGGIGLMESVMFVNALGITADESILPKITIISGRSCLMLRDRYRLGTKAKPSDPKCPRTQWFNEGNSMDELPDPSYAFTLKQRVPGTIISIRFTLDYQYLMQHVGNNDDD